MHMYIYVHVKIEEYVGIAATESANRYSYT